MTDRLNYFIRGSTLTAETQAELMRGQVPDSEYGSDGEEADGDLRSGVQVGFVMPRLDRAFDAVADLGDAGVRAAAGGDAVAAAAALSTPLMRFLTVMAGAAGLSVDALLKRPHPVADEATAAIMVRARTAVTTIWDAVMTSIEGAVGTAVDGMVSGRSVPALGDWIGIGVRESGVLLLAALASREPAGVKRAYEHLAATYRDRGELTRFDQLPDEFVAGLAQLRHVGVCVPTGDFYDTRGGASAGWIAVRQAVRMLIRCEAELASRPGTAPGELEQLEERATAAIAAAWEHISASPGVRALCSALRASREMTPESCQMAVMRHDATHARFARLCALCMAQANATGGRVYTDVGHSKILAENIRRAKNEFEFKLEVAGTRARWLP